MSTGIDNARWVLSRGSAKREGFDVAVTPEVSGWHHTGLYAVTLAPGEMREFETGECEFIVVPLAGSVEVSVSNTHSAPVQITLAGRESVFAGPTDVAYVPRGAQFAITTAQGARVALPFAKAGKRREALAVRHVAAGDVAVELRGAGRATREVRNFGTPQVLDADSIIACEVITPAGNWSSYPPHKHDVERAGAETELEEIYYFELQPEAGSGAPEGADAFGYQRVYGTADRPIDVLAEVRTGDVVLVPHGWHGPAMAPPGYDLYYLNVMAGPGSERAWLICDDPAHGWVRDTWVSQEIDPRLAARGVTP